MRQPVDLKKAFRLINHGPVTLITSAHGDARNIMAASWTMPLDFDPPKVALVIDKNAYTRELIEASGEFALNIPARAIAPAILKAGGSSGRAGDKFAACGLQTFAAERVSAPLVEGCVAWLECRLIPEPHNQEAYDLFIGEVVAAHADKRVFIDGRWRFEEDKLRTLHYVAGGTFFQTGDEVEAD
ncbi:NADH-FMN oxidoreductase RutF, flavin reductase (DIM6/NTAB) family [Formivibrio citricus]|uniref:NADH-FMN oxidoreductase RutF, flavin reductase (DIM6/NTAB) family n=1 Tax=Formivibrio citricus TaxID=83765 RepID=A0A1I5D824_9NEIS|nr:flavin reductase family protein [Formivibrio citricus]SFN95408.1 NADH-FMN oxidoreductase RutF, flavin reductase (DIM6/NTAB) family [Formivibrio citricus]